MPFLNDSEREERKRQLRRNMRVNRELIEEEREAEEDLYADSEDVSDAGPDRYDGYGDEDGYDSGNGEAVDEEEVASVEKRIRGKKLDRRKKIVLIAACAAAVAVIVLLVLTFSGWRSVSKKWTVDMPRVLISGSRIGASMTMAALASMTMPTMICTPPSAMQPIRIISVSPSGVKSAGSVKTVPGKTSETSCVRKSPKKPPVSAPKINVLSPHRPMRLKRFPESPFGAYFLPMRSDAAIFSIP